MLLMPQAREHWLHNRTFESGRAMKLRAIQRKR